MTHNSFRLNPSVYHIHNDVPSFDQQSGEPQIVIAKHVIVHVFVLPKNKVSFMVLLNHQATRAASLL